MDIEEMKRLWQEQNVLLDRYAAIHEEQLKNTYAQKAHGVIDRLLHWEVFGLIFFMIVFSYTAVCTYRLMDDARFLASGGFMILFSAACIISGISSVRLLLGISLYSQSIIDIKHTILRYKKRVVQGMKIIWVLIPFIVIAFLPMNVKIARHITLYDSTAFFTVFVIVTIPLSYVAAYISYQTILKKSIATLEENLKILEKYRVE